MRALKKISFRDKIPYLVQMKIFSRLPNWRQIHLRRERKPALGAGVTLALFLTSILTVIFFPAARAQQTDSEKSVVVQPGAPGASSKTLPSSTRATLPPRSPADVEFMQGMILHHAQAVEMTALITSHTQSKDLRALGARISSSQSDEIKFMKRWLTARGESVARTWAQNAGHGYVARHDGFDARNADGTADGSAAEGEGR